MRFLFVCSGTAGHINPALAVSGRLRELLPDAEILFVGAGRTLENRLVPLEGYKIVNIRASGFERGFSPRQIAANLKTIGNIAISSAQARKIIREFKPDAAVGTGGYVCYSVLKTAAKMGIPTMIHESNVIPGLTTKMLSDKVDKVLVAFPGVEKLYKKPGKVIVTGTPVRGNFSALTKEKARARLGLGDGPLVVSFWGSLGAEKMNEIMAEFIDLNAGKGGFNHIHATGGGEAGLKMMMERLSGKGIVSLPDGIDIRPYIDNMPEVMAAADIVLCRAGASTIAELEVLGKPALLVPSPYVTNNHQLKNAEALSRGGGAVMLEEKDCTGKKLYTEVISLLEDRQKLSEMSLSMKRLSAADAADKIAEIIISMC